MDERRLAAVFAVDGNGQAKTSTGYVVASRLILTAAHAVDPAGSIEVQLIDQANPMPCALIWNGREHDLDAALLEVEASYWPPSTPQEPVRFGRLATLQPHQPAETIGFPAAQRESGGDLESAHVFGHINPGDKLLSGQWVLSVAGTSPEDLEASPWAGISGAPLFSDGLLCGVIMSDPPHWRHGKLNAAQAHRLIQNEQFRGLLGERLGYSPVAEAVELRPLAEPATLSRPPRSLPELLRPQTETVRFSGRDEKLAEFRAWCQGDGVTARLITGPGGQGKTRFARELARVLAAEGWVVAQLRDNASVDSFQVLGKIGPPLLLIMDYADTRPGSVAEVMRVLEEEGSKGTVRIVLIARSAGEWWDQLPASASAYVSLLSGAAVVQLAPVADNLPTRQSLYRVALLDLARGLRRLADFAGFDWEGLARGLPAADLTDVRLGSALTLQIRALTDLLAAHPQAQPSQPGKPVEALFLAHEQSYWTRTARRRPLLAELTADELGDAVAAATLTRVTGKERAVELLAKVPSLSNSSERIRSAVAAWLSDLYPADAESYWGALEPDRLGEYHVSARIGKEPAFLPEFLPALRTDEAERALTVLGRAGAQPVCPCPDLLDHATALTIAHPESLAIPAASVATQSENPDFLIAALTSLASRSDLPSKLLEDLSTAFPAQTASLAEPALNIARCLVRANRKALGLAWLLPWAYRRRRVAQPPPADSAESPILLSDRTLAGADLARAYHNYSHRLVGLGRLKEATAAGERAVRLYRLLARRHPDLYQPFLAGSLDNQAIALSDTNRLGKALKASQQARAVHRALAADDSDTHLAALARSLNNVSEIFARLDTHQAALNTSAEAVAIFSQLTERKVGLYLPELANALHSQANHYARAGWSDKAELASTRTVAIRRRLAVQRPDANLPGLAHSLHNFSADLTAEEKTMAANRIINESISLYLRLVLDRGPRYLPHLANALNTRSVVYSGRNRDRERAVASARSILIYMRLTQESPEYRAGLATALRNYTWVRLEAGLFQSKQWDAVVEEAKKLAEHDSAKHPKPARYRGLKEDEEIKRLAAEVVRFNEEDLEDFAPEIEEFMDRYRGAPAPVKRSRFRSGITRTTRFFRDFAEVVLAICMLPWEWFKHYRRHRRSWRERWQSWRQWWSWRSWRDRFFSALELLGRAAATLAPTRVLRALSSRFRRGDDNTPVWMNDPRETMDYAYQRQLEKLQQVRRLAADVATQRKRAELQIGPLRRRQAPQEQIEDLESKYQSLQADEEKLTKISHRLQSKVDAFRSQKEIIKVTYTVAVAQRRIGAAISGLSQELGDIGMAIERVQDTPTYMQAWDGASGELRTSAAFDDTTGPDPLDIRAELELMDGDIAGELERLKAEISASSEDIDHE